MANTTIPSESVQYVGEGFRPTDKELVDHFLKLKTLGHDDKVRRIPELDIYKFEPWDLPQHCGTNSQEWYFFCPRHYKYLNSDRVKRTTSKGYWKGTGKDRKIEAGLTEATKKSLVYYVGRTPNGVRTPWIMHEYSANFGFPNQRNIVLCKLMKKPEKKANIVSCDEGKVSFNMSSNLGNPNPNGKVKPDDIIDISDYDASEEDGPSCNKTCDDHSPVSVNEGVTGNLMGCVTIPPQNPNQDADNSVYVGEHNHLSDLTPIAAANHTIDAAIPDQLDPGKLPYEGSFHGCNEQALSFRGCGSSLILPEDDPFHGLESLWPEFPF